MGSFPLMILGRVFFGFGGESLCVSVQTLIQQWFNESLRTLAPTSIVRRCELGPSPSASLCLPLSPSVSVCVRPPRSRSGSGWAWPSPWASTSRSLDWALSSTTSSRRPSPCTLRAVTTICRATMRCSRLALPAPALATPPLAQVCVCVRARARAPHLRLFPHSFPHANLISPSGGLLMRRSRRPLRAGVRLPRHGRRHCLLFRRLRHRRRR